MFSFSPPVWLDEAASTSTCLRERQLAAPDPSGTVLAAKVQTAGRGRMGNAWFSAPGTDLTFSFLWRGKIVPAEAGTFSLVCGLGTADFLRERGLAPQCKWPNDLLVNEKKISGILAESRSAGDGILEIVVGIGLNVRRHPGRDLAAGKPTTCLEDEGEREPSPDAVLPPLLAALEKRINAWRRGGFADLAADYARMLWGIGKPALVRTGRETIAGTIAGIDATGVLRLRMADGSLKSIASCVALEPAGEG